MYRNYLYGAAWLCLWSAFQVFGSPDLHCCCCQLLVQLALVSLHHSVHLGSVSMHAAILMKNDTVHMLYRPLSQRVHVGALLLPGTWQQLLSAAAQQASCAATEHDHGTTSHILLAAYLLKVRPR
jgi:hypothetical protein